MPILQSYVPQMPPLLALVNTALADMKQPAVTTVVGAKPLVTVMVSAINDAIIDIYTRAKWKFRIASQAVNMVAGQSDYLVPADFGSVEQDIQTSDRTIPFCPPQTFLETTTSTGQPSLFTLIDGDHLRFAPTPNADFVAKWPQLMLTYMRRPVLVVRDDDVPNLPMEFQDCLKTKARLRWKTAQEYSATDLQMENAIYEGQLNAKLNSYLMTPGKRLGMRIQTTMSPRVPYRKF